MSELDSGSGALKYMLMMRGGAMFTPSSISGLSIWLAARSLVLNDADPISTFTDQSGNGNSPTAATTARPTYKAAIQNGLAVARFDGVNDTMTKSFSDLAQPNTMIVVAKFNATGDQKLIDGLVGRNTFGISAGNWSDYAGAFLDSDAANTSWHIHGIQFNGASSVYRRDGVQIGAAANLGTQGLGGLNLGSDNSGAQWFNGDFAEALFYDSALTTPQLVQVENYLNGLYAIF